MPILLLPEISENVWVGEAVCDVPVLKGPASISPSGTRSATLESKQLYLHVKVGSAGSLSPERREPEAECRGRGVATVGKNFRLGLIFAWGIDIGARHVLRDLLTHRPWH